MFIFLAAQRYASAGISRRRVSVGLSACLSVCLCVCLCLSVCLSHTGIVPNG